MTAQTGLEPVGSVPWGSHFCHFYASPDDLSETLVPYMKTGLEMDEACLWVTAKPYPKERALSELNTVLPDLDGALASGQLKVYSHEEWYELHGRVSRADVAGAWLRAKDEALQHGFSALRVTGNTAFLEHADWADFMEYEGLLRQAFERQEILALCSYDTACCDAGAVLDVVRAHDFAVARRAGRWEMVESASVKRTKEELVALNANLDRIVSERTAELTEALEHQRLLVGELSHRVKNTVASIQAIVDQTLRHSDANAELRATLRGRLSALARAHESLAAAAWTGVSLKSLLRTLAAPYGDRIRLDFKSETLTPRATLNLGLAFHELATNAVKYGALSDPDGRVSITVRPRRRGEDLFEAVWTETGGPQVTAPETPGFGTHLIRQLIEHDLCGDCELHYEPSGLVCVLRAPASEVLAPRRTCIHGGH